VETHRHPIHVISANPIATIVEAAERRINDKLICLKSTLPTPHAVARPASTECGTYLSTHTLNSIDGIKSRTRSHPWDPWIPLHHHPR